MNYFAQTEGRVASPPSSRYSAEILVATTWACNLRCSYCFVYGNRLDEGQRRMTPELARRVVDALDEGLANVETICIHVYGGEPLLNLPAIETMVQRAHEKPAGRFRFAITTNGACASPQAIELLERGDFQVILSIDGPAEVHDQCRHTGAGAPTHAAVMDFLTQLRAHTHCWVRGSAVVRSGWSLSEATTYLQTLPVDAIKAQAVRADTNLPYALSPEEREAYLSDLEQLGRVVIAELENDRIPKDDRFSSRVLQLLMGTARHSFCGAGDTTFGVTPEGIVRPCLLLPPATGYLGHIADPPETWIEAGRRWRSRCHLRPECDTCPVRPLCGGGCPAMMPVCGADECEITRKNCEVARIIFEHFRSQPEKLLPLAGIASSEAQSAERSSRSGKGRAGRFN